MKNKFSNTLYLVIFSVVLLNIGCSNNSEVNRNGNSANINSVNSNQTNRDSTNDNQSNMNGMAMNHEIMNHSNMQTSADAQNAPYDLQFLDTMIAHHQSAVVMSKPTIEKASHDELKKLANNITVSQEKEIKQMREWREKWYAGKPSAMNMSMSGMSDSMNNMDMKKLESLSGNAFDLAFIDMMIPHHQGAVKMAKELLEKGEHPELKTLAQNIIMAQESEIKSMQDWKTKWSQK